MQELAIVVEKMPSEDEAKQLAAIGFTNIMLDAEKKLLSKQPQTGVKVIDTPADLTKENVETWKGEGLTRIILNAQIAEAADIQQAPENVTKISDAKKQKVNKVQMKRIQAYLERRRRAINKGIPEDKVDRYLAEEDWKNMPVPEKVGRLEHMIAQTFRGLSQDIVKLRQNDSTIGEAFDINNRMVFKMMMSLGITPEQQKKFAEEATAEYAADLKTKQEAEKAAQAAAQKKADEAAEKAKLTSIAAEEKHPVPQGVDVPEAATTFGG